MDQKRELKFQNGSITQEGTIDKFYSNLCIVAALMHFEAFMYQNAFYLLNLIHFTFDLNLKFAPLS